MDNDKLKWKITGKRRLLHTPIFDVIEQAEVSATGITGDYIAMEAHDWTIIIPEIDGDFILVRQWRHSSECMSLEFPGGVVDRGEEPVEAARRELLEETGFIAGEVTHLGSCFPNPALFKNRFHVFLARDLTPTGEQKLDDDELLTYERVPKEEALHSFGKGEYNHALMGTGLAFYLTANKGE